MLAMVRQRLTCGEKERVTMRSSFMVAVYSVSRSLCGINVDGKKKVMKKQRRREEICLGNFRACVGCPPMAGFKQLDFLQTWQVLGFLNWRMRWTHSYCVFRLTKTICSAKKNFSHWQGENPYGTQMSSEAQKCLSKFDKQPLHTSLFC
jgi:hypothetical protein